MGQRDVSGEEFDRGARAGCKDSHPLEAARAEGTSGAELIPESFAEGVIEVVVFRMLIHDVGELEQGPGNDLGRTRMPSAMHLQSRRFMPEGGHAGEMLAWQAKRFIDGCF